MKVNLSNSLADLVGGFCSLLNTTVLTAEEKPDFFAGETIFETLYNPVFHHFVDQRQRKAVEERLLFRVDFICSVRLNSSFGFGHSRLVEGTRSELLPYRLRLLCMNLQTGKPSQT